MLIYPELRDACKPFLDKIVKNPKDFVYITETALCQKYEVTEPRVDQAKERARTLMADLTALLTNIGTLLTTDPSIDSKLIYSTMKIGDAKNFVLNDFYYHIEYKRIDFDCFGRVRKTNEAKIKHFLLCYLLIKIMLVEVFANYDKVTNSKVKPSATL